MHSIEYLGKMVVLAQDGIKSPIGTCILSTMFALYAVILLQEALKSPTWRAFDRSRGFTTPFTASSLCR